MGADADANAGPGKREDDGEGEGVLPRSPKMIHKQSKEMQWLRCRAASFPCRAAALAAPLGPCRAQREFKINSATATATATTTAAAPVAAAPTES